jgi:hypothetical protein
VVGFCNTGVKYSGSGFSVFSSKTFKSNSLTVSGYDKYRINNLGIDGRIILKWILGKQGWRMWTGIIWLRVQTTGRKFPVPYKAGNSFTI